MSYSLNTNSHSSLNIIICNNQWPSHIKLIKWRRYLRIAEVYLFEQDVWTLLTTFLLHYRYFDFINLMTYDLRGAWWPNKAGIHSGLYASTNEAANEAALNAVGFFICHWTVVRLKRALVFLLSWLLNCIGIWVNLIYKWMID